MIGMILLGLIISLTFYLAFVSRYDLGQFGNRPRQTIGSLNQYSNEGALLYITAFGVVFGAYGLGYLLLKPTVRKHRVTTTQYLWLLVTAVGFGLAFNLVLLSMYPADAADVYDNIIRGRMSAIFGLNPLKDTPNQEKQDPFYQFSAWRNVPSAYGPVWEMVAQASVRAVNNSDRNANVVAFKLVGAIGYCITTLFIALALFRIAPRRILIGVYLWMWNPLAVYMTAGIGHNDALMATCILGAVYFVSRRWYVAGTLAAVLGALVKFIPVLLLPLIVVVAFRTLGWRRWLRYLAVSGILGGVLVIGAYAPYWHGWETLRTERRALMYTGSVATVVREFLIPVLDNAAINASPTSTPVTNALLANGTIVLIGLAYIGQLVYLWRTPDPSTLIRVAARLLLVYLLVASLWFHGWYVIWVLPLVALLEDTPMRRLVMIFSYLVTWQVLMYNYIVVTTKGGGWLPWGDLVPVTIYMGYAWGYTGWYWFRTWVQKRERSADNEQIGRRIGDARQSVQLSLSEMSDDLGIRYDVLEQYERGERPLQLDHGHLIAQRLGLSLDDLLGMKA